ncbi:enolase C-terminal domain-like protein [Ramlibacter sp.]|uniref:enolase C-terminal domain-like protein n=1 Tax=Ramlibacter sp. TaxID=1917967 RepID=UPI003D11B530
MIAAQADVKVRGVRVRTVLLDVRQPLETASGSFSKWPVLLLDLQTDAGVTGHAYVGLFLPMMLKPVAAMLQQVGGLIEGDTLAPLDLDRKLRARTRLIGTHGPLATACALIEIAAWDALAKSAKLPLVRLLGAAPRALPVYKTLVAMDPAKAADLAREAIADGYGGVKLKLGHPSVRKDLALVAAVRAVVGDDFPMMGDYNQILSVPEAAARIRAIDGEGLVWIEEPVAARDYAGCAQLARGAATPISIGENWLTLADAADSLRANASDYAMPDVVKMGGIANWMKAATLCEAHGVPVSAHSFPEICGHLLPGCGAAHWLEHVGMADAVMRASFKPTAGAWKVSEAPGLGIDWNEDVIAASLVDL